MLNANDVQYGGSHYKDKAIQPWDYITSNGLGFLEGNAVKYLSRWRDKNGDGTSNIEDLKKAIHYIEKLIEIESAKATITPLGVLHDGTVVGKHSITGKIQPLPRDDFYDKLREAEINTVEAPPINLEAFNRP